MHQPPASSVRRGRIGFTLVEVLLAVTLGALLVTATATMTGSFGETVAQLDTDSVDSREAALARVSRDVRYAWWVETPDAGTLRIADTNNAVTEYFRVGDSLLVERPDGSQGAVISGLSNVVFASTTTRRLREGPTVSANGRIDGVGVPIAVSGSIKLLPNNKLCMAFDLSSYAGPLTASGVDDRVLRCLPDRLDLRLARLAPTGMLRVQIYPSRSPGDARPRPGAATVVDFTVPLSSLPPGVILLPGSDPLDLRTAHYLAPLTTTSLAIPASATRLPAGTGYCIALSVTGTGNTMGIVGAWAAAGGAQRSVAFRHAAADPWTDLPAVIPMGLFGDKTRTTTESANVVTQVAITLTDSAGTAHVASACPSGQVLAEDPWLGVVSGETPSLP